MNDTILAEFVFTRDEVMAGMDALHQLGDDFSIISTVPNNIAFVIVRGKLSSYSATIIKLEGSLLGKAMQISYISDELKNKYRR